MPSKRNRPTLSTLPRHQQWVRVTDAATILGVHPATIRNRITSGDIPSVLTYTPKPNIQYIHRAVCDWPNQVDAITAIAKAEVATITVNVAPPRLIDSPSAVDGERNPQS